MYSDDDLDEKRDYGDDYGDDYEDDYGDYSGDDIEYDGDSGEEWTTEFKDRERTGGSIGCWATDNKGVPLKTQSPLGRFCLKVDAVSRNISSECNFPISQGEIQKLLEKSQELHRVEFKNPTAFVLGYLATLGGTKVIKKSALDSVWGCYKKLQNVNTDFTIKKPDIIRYARLWHK